MINRVLAQRVIERIPVTLRDAARFERRVIQKELVKEPIYTSVKVSHGQFSFVNNENLLKKLKDIKTQFVKEIYPLKMLGMNSTTDANLLANTNDIVYSNLFLG